MAAPMKETRFTRLVLGLLEPIVIQRRRGTLIVLALVTVFLAWQASMLKPQAGWLKMVPQEHPYMQTFLEYYKDFGGANTVLVSAEAVDGRDVYNPEFLEMLRQLTDEVFFIPGTDRARVTSIFTPNILYVEVIEGGLAGETVVPRDYTSPPTPEMVARIRANVGKANVIGRLVSENGKSAMVVAELLDRDPVSGEPLDYVAVGDKLEAIRAQFENDNIKIHIIGFAKVVDDMTDATVEVAGFFVIALGLMGLLLWIYIGSLPLAALVVATSIVACIWEMGLLHLIGFGLDPFAMLVPFLIMSVSVSHAVQYVNAWAYEITAREHTSYQASLATFRALFIPGIVALVTNVVGFSTIYLINIDVIREMSINAAFGMVGVIMVNKMLLPAVLSYLKIPNVEAFKVAAAKRERMGDSLFRRMAVLCRRGPATITVLIMFALAAFGASRYKHVEIGDTTEGVPELRPDSRFNRDAAAIAAHFSLGVDQLKVIAETRPDACIDHAIMSEIDNFGWYMKNQPGVRDVMSLLDLSKLAYAGLNEGRLNSELLPRNPQSLAQSTALVPTTSGLYNDDCDALAVFIFTVDHKAPTIEKLVAAVKTYEADVNQTRCRKAREPGTDRDEACVTFRLASGNVGVMAATNEDVERQELPLIYWVYGAIIIFLWLSFRTLSGVLCVILPLGTVTLLGYPMMEWLGIGQKVATLPVLAFACGVGVDYGIYSYTVVAEGLRRGLSLEDAYYQKMRSTGKATLFTGIGMAAGVALWLFSDLQFQRDMGALLFFGFFTNMLGAIIVLPALAHFLSKEELKHKGEDLTAGADTVIHEKGPR
jgi:predicted RND superfamily exporter protein